MTAQAWKAIILLLLLAGCATNPYQDVCDVRQPDKDGTGGYTKGTFACKLSHHEGAKPAPPPQ